MRGTFAPPGPPGLITGKPWQSAEHSMLEWQADPQVNNAFLELHAYKSSVQMTQAQYGNL